MNELKKIERNRKEIEEIGKELIKVKLFLKDVIKHIILNNLRQYMFVIIILKMVLLIWKW